MSCSKRPRKTAMARTCWCVPTVPRNAGSTTTTTSRHRCGMICQRARCLATATWLSRGAADARRASQNWRSAARPFNCTHPSASRAPPHWHCGRCTPSSPSHPLALRRSNGCSSPPWPPSPWKTPSSACVGMPCAGTLRSTSHAASIKVNLRGCWRAFRRRHLAVASGNAAHGVGGVGARARRRRPTPAIGDAHRGSLGGPAIGLCAAR